MIVFIFISIGLIYLMFNLGQLSNSLNSMSKDFNNDSVFVYLPTTEQYHFSINENEDVNFYGDKSVLIDGSMYNVYLSSSTVFDLYFFSDRWTKYYKDETLTPKTIYQHNQTLEGIIQKDLNKNALFADNQYLDSFLYMQQEKNDFTEEDVKLMVFKRESDFYTAFVSKFGLPSNTFSIDGNPFYVNGNSIYNQTVGILKGFLTFFYVLYLVPTILIFFVFYYAYNVFLSNELTTMKIKQVFYMKKARLWLKNFLPNLVLFLFSYLFVIILFSFNFSVYIETIRFITITFFVVAVILALSAYKIINVAIKKDLN